MSVSINGTSASSLGVVSCSINLSSQDTDTAEIRVNSATSPFSIGNAITIVYGSRTVFTGRVSNVGPRTEVAPTSFYIAIQCEGSFDSLKNIPWETTAASVTWPLAGNLGSQPTTRYNFSGMTAAAILDAIKLRASQSGIYTGGTISNGLPSTIIPTFEGTGGTCGSMLRSLLGFISAGLAYYSGSTLNVTTAGSTSSINIATAQHARKFALNTKSLLDFVRLNYWRSASRTVNNVHQSGVVTITPSSGRLWVAKQDAGSASGSRWYEADVELNGALVQNRYEFQFGTNIQTLKSWITTKGGTGGAYYTYGDLLRNCGKGVMMANYVAGSFTAWAPRQDYPHLRQWGIEDTSNNTLDGSTWYPILTREWKLQPEILRQVTDDNAYNWGEMIVRSGWGTSTTATPAHFQTDNFICIQRKDGGTMDNRLLTVTKESYSGTLENPPSGAASSIYNAFRSSFYEGQLEMYIDSWAGQWAVAVNGVSSPVQTISMDLASGKMTMNFGAPNQIRPDDIIAALRRRA